MESQDSSSHHNHNHNHNHNQQQPFPTTVFPSQIQNPNNNFSIIQNQNPTFPFNTIIQHQHQQHNHKNNYTTADEINNNNNNPSGSVGLGIEPARKKRGRPRKYSPENNNTNNSNIGLGLSPTGQHLSTEPAGLDSSGKRNRGRPPGSVKKQLDALGLPGVGFTPHVILVNKGEDIASKIMAFSQQGPRTVCILSANGAVSNVTLRQAAMSGGTVTYEGRFEIISLSGSFMLVESNGNRSRSGSLSVSLAGSDGRVLGGGVAGVLKAATPVQVIVGSFIADGKRPKALRLLSSPPPSSMLDFSAPITKTSPSLDASSESAGESDESPLNHGTGPYNTNTNSVQAHQNMPPPMYSNMGWPNSMKME